MDQPSDQRLTSMLQAAGMGDTAAAASLLPLVYDELRRLARARMARTPPGNTLQPTALVHEAFLRLVGPGKPDWRSSGHFFAAAAQAMRRILVDQARRKAAVVRGGRRQRSDIDADDLPIQEPVEDIVALDIALERLRREDARKAEIVDLRYFAGLSREETAAALGTSVRTIDREWRFIIARLHRDIERHESDA